MKELKKAENIVIDQQFKSQLRSKIVSMTAVGEIQQQEPRQSFFKNFHNFRLYFAAIPALMILVITVYGLNDFSVMMDNTGKSNVIKETPPLSQKLKIPEADAVSEPESSSLNAETSTPAAGSNQQQPVLNPKNSGSSSQADAETSKPDNRNSGEPEAASAAASLSEPVAEKNSTSTLNNDAQISNDAQTNILSSSDIPSANTTANTNQSADSQTNDNFDAVSKNVTDTNKDSNSDQKIKNEVPATADQTTSQTTSERTVSDDPNAPGPASLAAPTMPTPQVTNPYISFNGSFTQNEKTYFESTLIPQLQQGKSLNFTTVTRNADAASVTVTLYFQDGTRRVNNYVFDAANGQWKPKISTNMTNNILQYTVESEPGFEYIKIN